MLNYQRVSFKDGALLSKKLSCPLCSKVTPFVNLFEHMQRSFQRNPAALYLDSSSIYLKERLHSPQGELYIPKGLTPERKIAHPQGIPVHV